MKMSDKGDEGGREATMAEDESENDDASGKWVMAPGQSRYS